GVHPDRDHRQVLGQGEQLVGPQMVLEPESPRSAKRNAGGDLPLPEQGELGVGEEGPAASVSFTEIRGQLQAVLHHSCLPTSMPGATAAIPATMLTTTFAATRGSWRSSARRWVSNIQVENVVYEPTAAVPASSARSWFTESPVIRPSVTAPVRLT